MDLKRLHHLLAVVEHGTFSTAAETLGLTQSGLTKSIQSLEEECGEALFIRHSRGVTPNELGQLLVKHAHVIENDVRKAMAEVEAKRQRRTEKIIVGADPDVMTYPLAPAIAEVVRLRSDIHILCKGGFNTIELAGALLHGEIDLVIGFPPEGSDAEELSFKPLFDVEQGVVARADHPLLAVQQLRFEDLDEYGWILPVRGTNFRRRLEGFHESRGRPLPRPTIEADSMGFILDLVAATDMVGVSVEHAIVLFGSDRVKFLDLPFTWRRPVGILTRRDEPLSDAGHHLCDRMQRICSAHKSVPGEHSSPP